MMITLSMILPLAKTRIHFVIEYWDNSVEVVISRSSGTSKVEDLTNGSRTIKT